MLQEDVFARCTSGVSFGHLRGAAERELRLAAYWPVQAEGRSRYHGMDSRKPPEGCPRLVPWAIASPAIAGPLTPAPPFVPLPIQGRCSCRLVRAARIQR